MNRGPGFQVPIGPIGRKSPRPYRHGPTRTRARRSPLADRVRRNFYYSESQGRAAGPRSSCQRRPPGPERHGCPGLSQCCVPGPAARASPVTAQHGGQCARPDGSSESDGLPNLKHKFLTNFLTLHFHGLMEQHAAPIQKGRLQQADLLASVVSECCDSLKFLKLLVALREQQCVL